MASDRLLEKRWNAREVEGAEYGAHVRQLLDQVLTLMLPNTTPYANDALFEIGMSRKLYVLKRSDLTFEARFCCCTHTAGHINDDLGFFDRIDTACTRVFEHTNDAF